MHSHRKGLRAPEGFSIHIRGRMCEVGCERYVGSMLLSIGRALVSRELVSRFACGAAGTAEG